MHKTEHAQLLTGSYCREEKTAHIMALVVLAKLEHSCVKGHHVYRKTLSIGSICACEREPSNLHSHWAIVVKKDGDTIGECVIGGLDYWTGLLDWPLNPNLTTKINFVVLEIV